MSTDATTLRDVEPGEERLAAGVMIYALADPETEAVRYIGQTRTPGRRLKQHLRPSGNRYNPHMNDWLKSLRDRDLVPRMLELEIVSDGDAGEVRWIAKYQSRGATLLNMNSGGASLEQAHQAIATGARKTLYCRVMEAMKHDLNWIRRHSSKDVVDRAETKHKALIARIKAGERMFGKQGFRERFEAALILRGETP